ncbi:MAG: hypothetical protein MK078_12835 [Crocinitomicaceae bacterium]|nr:hypothetical protein [Crocinitomicaceae bacterium]
MDPEITQEVLDQIALDEHEAKKSLWIVALYITAGVFLLLTAYVMYKKRKMRGRLAAVNNITLTSNRDDNYTQDTEFLISSPEVEAVKLSILNDKEEEIEVLFDEEILTKEVRVPFVVSNYKPGSYYLSLSSTSTNIFRKIRIS